VIEIYWKYYFSRLRNIGNCAFFKYEAENMKVTRKFEHDMEKLGGICYN
jgi:hypothetical protein